MFEYLVSNLFLLKSKKSEFGLLKLFYEQNKNLRILTKFIFLKYFFRKFLKTAFGTLFIRIVFFQYFFYKIIV